MHVHLGHTRDRRMIYRSMMLGSCWPALLIRCWEHPQTVLLVILLYSFGSLRLALKELYISSISNDIVLHKIYLLALDV
ncbi:hypothetical protein V8B55DRAFT_1478767 [Mucor lusitanicus]